MKSLQRIWPQKCKHSQESRRQICIHYRYSNLCVSVCYSLPKALCGRVERMRSFISVDVPINQPDTDGDHCALTLSLTQACAHTRTHTHTVVANPCLLVFCLKASLFFTGSGGCSLLSPDCGSLVPLNTNTHTS